MRGFLISAPYSGCGKTVLTMGLLQILKNQRKSVAAFKCGPDYIDPAFHAKVLDLPCKNLDTFLMGEDAVRREFFSAFRENEVAVIEGAMGLYDGLGGTREHSAYATAKLLGVPVLLVLDVTRFDWRGEYRQMLSSDEAHLIRGVIFNRVFDGEMPTLPSVEGMEPPMVLGMVEKLPEIELPSRHLGLVQSKELPDLRGKVELFAQRMEDGLELSALWKMGELTGTAQEVDYAVFGHGWDGPRIAVAMDEAFSFYYDASLRAMEEEGATLCFFSPLRDTALPKDISGLYIGGGYPELYARELSANVSMRKSIYAALKAHLPAIAECGGFLYLQETLFDKAGTPYEMVGYLKGSSKKQDRLVRFGYGMLQSGTDGLLFQKGEEAPFHEFHYWDSTKNGGDLSAYKPLKPEKHWEFGYHTPWLYAGFPHFFYGKRLAKRFVDAAMRFWMEKNWNELAKPLGSLGRLEEEIARIGVLQRNPKVTMAHPRLYVLCADNGVVAENVSQSDKKVTEQVARALGQKTSTVSFMAKEAGCEVVPVDVGMNCPADIPGVWNYKIANGTKNMAVEQAMTDKEMHRAFAVGKELVERAIGDGCDLLLLGEMGIGNTTTATAIASVLLEISPYEIAGPGAGLPKDGIVHKAKVISSAIALHGCDRADCKRLLRSIGGFDIAVMAGMLLEARKVRLPVLLDGFITGVAALLAVEMEPDVKDVILPSHQSSEPGAKKVFEALGISPVLDAKMHLGEGSGAVAALGVYRCALAVYQSGHTFAHLGIEAYEAYDL